MSGPPEGEKKRWLDDRHNVDKVWYALLGLCAALFAADALYHKHTILHFEEWFGFYAIYGFVACVALVLAAKELRKLVMRREHYYDPPEEAYERHDDAD